MVFSKLTLRQNCSFLNIFSLAVRSSRFFLNYPATSSYYDLNIVFLWYGSTTLTRPCVSPPSGSLLCNFLCLAPAMHIFVEGRSRRALYITISKLSYENFSRFYSSPRLASITGPTKLNMSLHNAQVDISNHKKFAKRNRAAKIRTKDAVREK